MNDLTAIFICAIMPIAIVLIIYLANINSDNKRAQVLIKAIESNNSINADKLAAALSKPKKSALDTLNKRLLKGCIFSFIGLGLISVSIINYVNGTLVEDDPVEVPMVFGGASLAIGLSYAIVYLVTRKQVNEHNQD